MCFLDASKWTDRAVEYVAAAYLTFLPALSTYAHSHTLRHTHTRATLGPKRHVSGRSVLESTRLLGRRITAFQKYIIIPTQNISRCPYQYKVVNSILQLPMGLSSNRFDSFIILFQNKQKYNIRNAITQSKPLNSLQHIFIKKNRYI